MMPLRTNEPPRPLALVGEGFGIDHTAGMLTAIAGWVVGGLALLFLIGSLVRGETTSAMVSVLALITGGAIRLVASAIRRETRGAQWQRLDVELGWAEQQSFRVSGYRSYVTGSRPVFDLVLTCTGNEQRIIDELKRLDARILTSAEPGRVRVEVPARQVAIQVEHAPPIDAPDLELMKHAIACVRRLGVELDVEMGTHP